MARAVKVSEMTLDDLIELGVDAVDTRLLQANPQLALAGLRKYVSQQARTRARQKALNAERRAYGMAKGEAPDNLAALVLSASMDAARQATITWRPLLNVPFLVPQRDIQTTWGEATTDMHVERAQWLEHIATGNLRTASTHRKAVEDIADSKVSTLFEAVVKRGLD